MKAAIISELGGAPHYGDFDVPTPAPDEQRVFVHAAALSPLTQARALGQHYTAHPTVPFVMGVDGTGTLEDGRRVFFLMPRAPFGAMAEQCVVHQDQCIAVPDALDDVRAAALGNPGVSSWAALRLRTSFQRGQRVLINGATGASGMMAVQIARHLGASEIVVTGRNEKVLSSLKELGATATLSLHDDNEALPEQLEAQFRRGIDVVLDYLWGPSAEQILRAAAKATKPATPMRFVQIGNASAGDARIAGAHLRSAAIEMVGSGFGSIRMSDFMRCIDEMLKAAPEAKFHLPVKTLKLADASTFFAKRSALPRAVVRIA